MQIPKTVLHEALIGVGTNSQRLTTSGRFRRQVFQEKKRLRGALARCTLESNATRLGHLECGARINPYSGLSPLETPQMQSPRAIYEAADRAALVLFGEQLIRSAQEALPLALQKLAREFARSKSAKRQLEILEELRAAIEPQGVDSFIDDMCNQPKERVLPGLYRDWKAKKIEPNCLGKSQLVAAFLTLANARAYSVIPYQSAHEYHTVLQGKLGKELRAQIDSIELAQEKWPSHLLVASWHARATLRDAKSVENRPSYTHLAVVTQLVDGSWAYVDANWLYAGPLPPGFGMQGIADALDRITPALPGMTLSSRSDHLDLIYDLERRIEYLRTITAFFKVSLRHDFRVNRIVDLFAKSDTMKVLRGISKELYDAATQEERDRVNAARHVDRPYTDREVALVLFLEHGPRKVGTAKEFSKRAFDNTYAELLTPAWLKKAVPAVVSWVYFLANRSEERAKRKIFESPPPEMEFGSLSYQLGIHTLRHLAVNMEVADEMNSALIEHGFGQYLLQDALSLKVRSPDWREVNPHAERAEAILRALPYCLRSANFLLHSERIG